MFLYGQGPRRRIDVALATSYHSCTLLEFLDFVLRQLIDFPDEMILSKIEANRKIIFRLQLRKSDVGKVIGKHGQTIIAIRNLLSAAASRHGEKAILEIVE